MTDKEMTDFGAVRRLRDVLVSTIHSEFTSRADMYLNQGIIDQNERILLSGQISKALKAFNDGLPDDLANRPVDVPNAVPMPDMPMMKVIENVKKVVDKAMGIIDWLTEAKGFDTSPWNGSASQWKDASSYCSSCLIDNNKPGQEKTKDNCHLPYKKPGSSQINKNALRAMVGAHGIPALKASPADKAKAAKWVVSHWKSAFGNPAPDSMYRMAGMTPPKAAEKSSAVFMKDAKGDWWTLLIYSNKYEDRDTDIISTKGHQEFVQWVNDKGFRPHVALFHQPALSEKFWINVFSKYGNDIDKLNEIVREVYQKSGLGLAEVQKISYINGFTVMVAKVYEDKKAVAEKLAGMKNLGTSHSFVVMDFSLRKNKGMIVDKYRTFEGTILPRHRAANLLTLSVLQEKAMSKTVKLSDEDREWFGNVLGEEVVESLEKNTKELEEKLDVLLAFKATATDSEDMMDQEGDMPAEDMPPKKKKGTKPAAKKGLDVEEDEDPEEAEVEEPEVADQDTEPVPEVAVAAVAEEVIKALNVEELKNVLAQLGQTQKELMEKVDQLEGLRADVATLKKSDDDKIAAAITPINWGMFQPSKAKETAPKKQEDLQKQAKEDGPSAPDATKIDPNNPLQVGFWGQLAGINKP